MPFLTAYSSLVEHGERQRKNQDEGSRPAISNRQQAARVDFTQRPPELTHIPTAIDDDQLANPRNTEPNASAALVQQLPIITSNDQVTEPTVPIVSSSPVHSQYLTNNQSNSISSTLLQCLGERVKFSAMHDSSARSYPPRCHPDTRKTLRSRIVDWGLRSGYGERMFWVLGPPAVGKSAVAQTTAEEFKEKDRLGASFFFSRPNNLDDPDWVIPTLSYQLAVKHSHYKNIITQLLIDDPSILEKNRPTQFRQLIIEPFRTLMTKPPDTVREPLLIILDGLDECKDKQAQCEFIDLISTHVQQVENFPLRWMICSRPEWHLKPMILDPDLRVVCKREEIEFYDREARGDVERLLEAGLDNIRKKYSDRLPAGWPLAKDHIQHIAAAISGHLGLVSFILRFMGDEECGDPDGQLQICVRFFDGSGGTVGTPNPLHAIDLLYRQILSSVPVERLPTARRILGLAIISRIHFSTSGEQASFLNLDWATFQRSLQHLHSVVSVPRMNEPGVTLHVYHASFSDFLMDSNRSGNYWLNKEAAECDYVLQCLNLLENKDGSYSLPMINSCALKVWNSGRILHNDAISALISRLEHFNFKCIIGADGVWGGGHMFSEFLSWLYSLESTRNRSIIVLVEENSHEHAPPEIILIHTPSSAHGYIASFIPDIAAPVLPFLLRLRLGKSAPVHITLAVIDIEIERAVWVLEDPFHRIRQRFKDHLPTNWPPRIDLIRIAVVTRRNPHITSFLTGFIGDTTRSDPDGQLKVCVKLLAGGATVAADNSSNVLDPFYRHILSNVPPDLLSTIKHILGLLITHPYGLRSFHNQARFFNIDQATFQKLLQHLQCAVCVPPMDKYNTILLTIHHMSFSDFLTDTNRSGDYLLTKEAANYDFALQCLRRLEDDDELSSNKDVIKFCVSKVWDACRKLSNDFIPVFISRLECFDFTRLTRTHITPDSLHKSGFAKFLQWLYSLGNTHNKTVITLVQETPPEHVSKEILMTHCVASPYDYIASFIPGVAAPAPPADARLLQLRLGKSTPVHITLAVVDHEAQKIMWRLQDGIGKIQQQFHDRLPANWPPGPDLFRLAAAAHGDHDIASFLIRFIGDATCGDPDGQLKVCMKLLGGDDAINIVNPPNKLQVDPFYRQILSSIPLEDLPTTLQILGLTIEHRYGLRSCDNQARFLNLDQATFHQLLRRLYPVVYVPPTDKSNATLPRVHHTSFSDFLFDPNRSGEYWLSERMDYDFALKCLHWLEHYDGPALNKDVIGFCASQVWDTCRKLSDDFVPAFISRLEYFDFTRSRYTHLIPDSSYESSFGNFLQWLYSLGSARNKFVIALVQETPKHEFKGIQVEHRPSSPHAYITSFIPDIQVPVALPFTLQLRLGKAARVRITLIVVG